jgi:GTPase SAR1 family protein
LTEVRTYADKDVEVMLLGNKCDREESRQVIEEQAQQFAKQKNMLFYETSAKESTGVITAFCSAAKKLLAKK